jgi:ketosteroid isomerase-like protein
MRMTWGRALAVLMTVTLAGCGGSAPSQEFGKPDVDQIKQMMQDFVTAFNARDVDKLATFYSANAALMPANRSTLRGIDAVKGYYDLQFKEDGARDLTLEPITEEGHGPLGFVAGTFTLTFEPPNGGPARHDRGKTIWIVRKFSGQWKIEWQVTSSDLPPPEAPPAK